MVVRCLLAIAALLLVGATPPPSELPVGVLLERAARASGEPWRYHVASRIVGAVQGRIVETRYDAEGERIIMRRCSANVCTGSYMDGTRQAVFSYNETLIPQAQPSDPFAITLRALSSYAFTSQSFRAVGGLVESAGLRVLDGATLDVVAVKAPGGATLQALIDPQDGLLRAFAAPDGTLIARYADTRRVGPLALPFEVRLANGSVDRFEEREIVAEPLVPPAGPHATFSSTTEPLHLDGGSAVPRFPCRVENVATTCLLDTGASGLAMSLDLADRLHKNPIGQLVLEGLGSVLTGVVRADSLELGSMRLGSALYAILPDTGAFKADVVLGADVIGRAVVRLDLHQHTIDFAPLGSALHGDVLPIEFDAFTPNLAIRLGDFRSLLALDTGDEASIDLPIAVYRTHPDLFVTRERKTVVGVGGRGVQLVGRISRVQLGGFTFTDVPIGATDVGSPTRPRIGAEFLTRVAIDLDYANARAALARER